MLRLIWVLRGSISMLRTCENCMGVLAWLNCVGMLGWPKWEGVLCWLDLACPTTWTCLFNFFIAYGLGPRPLPHPYVYAIGLGPRPSYIFPLIKTAYEMGK